MLELPVPEGRTIRVTYSAHVLSSVCKDHSVERQGSSEEVHPGSRVRTQASTLGVQPLRFKRSCIGCVIFYRDAGVTRNDDAVAELCRDNTKSGRNTSGDDGGVPGPPLKCEHSYELEHCVKVFKRRLQRENLPAESSANARWSPELVSPGTRRERCNSWFR